MSLGQLDPAIATLGSIRDAWIAKSMGSLGSFALAESAMLSSSVIADRRWFTAR